MKHPICPTGVDQALFELLVRFAESGLDGYRRSVRITEAIESTGLIDKAPQQRASGETE